MDSEKEEKQPVEDESDGKKGKRMKRVVDSALKQKSSKKPKVMKSAKDEYQLLGRMEAKNIDVYKLTRADGSLSYHGDTQAFLRRLDRQDLNDLYRLVQERFQDHPLEGHDLLL
ncbi:hypothetical protein Tco_0336525 [Tanacetum coccineum]